MTRGIFRFNKAGQGCFYTGFLEAANRSAQAFSLVYDCGTLSSAGYLQNEIYKFHVSAKVKSSGKLNLLLISHFDADHVNQLRLLLTGVTGIEYIILPYLTPAERLLVYLQAEEADADFISFLTNPAGFLKSLNATIGKILFVKGGEGSEEGINPDRPPLNTPDNETGWKCDYSELKKITNLGDFGDASVEIVQDKGRFFVGDTWEFYFYNKPIDPTALVDFVKEVETWFPNLFDRSAFQKLDCLTEECIGQLKEKYKTLIGENLNPSSLVVYHAPFHENTSCPVFIYKHTHHHYKASKGGPASLLMGDIYLKNLRFPPYIIDNGNKITVVQIPHHGAATQWDFIVLNNLLGHNPIAVINFGLGNTHKHPKQEVVDDIKAAGWKIKLNHQLKAFKYIAYGSH